jgi:hypothetical protein
MLDCIFLEFCLKHLVLMVKTMACTPVQDASWLLLFLLVSSDVMEDMVFNSVPTKQVFFIPTFHSSHVLLFLC